MKVYDNQEYKEHVKSLYGEYRECYDKIEGYVKVCFRGSNDSEEQCVNQILGELISAQNSNKPLSKVIGTNLKVYCDKYINSNQSPNAKQINLLQTTGVYATIILILILVKGIKLYSYDFANNLSFGSIEAIALSYAVYWSVIRLYLIKFFIKNNKKIKNLDLMLNVIFILFIFPLINMGSNLLNFDIKLPLIVFIIMIAFVVLLFVYINKLRKSEITNE